MNDQIKIISISINNFKTKIMDSRNFSFSSPSYNVNSWGSVTNNMGQTIGNVDRFGSFQNNLTPWYSNNVDRFGSISNGYNGMGTQIGKINNYDSYQKTNNLRTSMDYLNKKNQDDSLYGKFKKSYEPELKMPKYEPIIPFKEPKVSLKSYETDYFIPKTDPIIPFKEPKVSFKSYEPEYKMPKYEPFIPLREPKFSLKSFEPDYFVPKIDPIIPFKEPKVYFNPPASVPLFPYTSNKKKSSFEDDYGYKFKF